MKSLKFIAIALLMALGTAASAQGLSQDSEKYPESADHVWVNIHDLGNIYGNGTITITFTNSNPSVSSSIVHDFYIGQGGSFGSYFVGNYNYYKPSRVQITVTIMGQNDNYAAYYNGPQTDNIIIFTASGFNPFINNEGKPVLD